MVCFVYVLYSEEFDSYYIGSTTNVSSRLSKHLSKHGGYTSKANDWKVVYQERHESKADALKRERQLKNWKSKIRIKQLIDRNNSLERGLDP